jgi:hypothetical protein
MVSAPEGESVMIELLVWAFVALPFLYILGASLAIIRRRWSARSQ